MPAAGMSFVQLEGNYVISFRDMNECLPAFTAVKLDRRRGSWDGGSPATGSTTNLAAAGAGSRRGSVGVFGSTPALTTGGGVGGSSPGGGSLSGSRLALGDDLAAAGAGGRRKSSVAATPYKLVLTGVPRSVREDAIRAQVDSVIPGIERVYRDPDMARNLSHPPVFVETRSVLAPDAFMLRAEWVPAVQRLVKQANAPAASEDEGIGMSLRASANASSTSALDEAAREEERRRRESLVDTLVTCPHGRYHGQATCPQCRASARRNTMVSDDIVGHNIFGDGVAPWRPVNPTILEQSHSSEASPPPPPKKSSSACSSCLACLRRLVPGMKRRPVQDDEDDDQVDGQQLQRQAPQVRVHAEHHFQQVQEKRVTVSATESNVLDSNFLIAIKSQRRLSAYDDVPAIKVDDVDFKQCNNALL